MNVKPLLSIPLLAWSVVASAETIQLTATEAVYSAKDYWLPDMETAFALAGHTLEVIPLPGNRALRYANDGTYQGDVYRGEFIQNYAPNLVPILVPISTDTLYAYGISAEPVASLSDLNKLQSLGLAGYEYFRELGPELTQDINWLKTYTDVENLLMRRANTMVVINEDDIQSLTDAGLIQGSGWHKLYPEPIKQFEFYCFLHKDYQYLIPDLEKAFAEVYNQ